VTDDGAALIGRALTDCVRPAPSNSMQEVVDRGLLPRLVDAGRYHRVLNMVHLAVKDLRDADVELKAALDRYYLHQIGHHLRALADLGSLSRAFSEHAVPWLLVKGPVLSECVYERSDLRVYNDLDVVIDREAFPEAIDVLEAAGFTLLDRNWDLIRRERRAQLHVSLALGTVGDVHHHLLNRATVRGSLSLPMDELFERARTVDVGNVQVRTLDPTDTLLHLCIHAGLAGGDRLLWMKDVQQALRSRSLPWDEIIGRARRWRAGPLVAVVLRRTRSEIGAAVPESAIDSLFRSKSRSTMSAGIDRAWPASRSSGRVTPSIVWAQVIRDTWTTTIDAFVRRASRRLRKTAHRGEEEDWQHPVGDGGRGAHDEAEERSRYLHEVTDPPRSAGRLTDREDPSRSGPQ
jgi:hypothetical protein